MADDGSSHYQDEFYPVRKSLHNEDVADNARGRSPLGEELLERLAEWVTLDPPAMGVRDIHSLGDRRAWAAFRVYGPKALAGDDDALQPIIVNNTVGAQEPRIVAIMRDRMACLQEITTGLNEYEEDEQEVFQRLRERGVLPSLDAEDWDDEEDEDGE